jgi:hypothetical protein
MTIVRVLILDATLGPSPRIAERFVDGAWRDGQRLAFALDFGAEGVTLQLKGATVDNPARRAMETTMAGH